MTTDDEVREILRGDYEFTALPICCRFTTDGPVDVRIALATADESELYLTRPTRRQRIGGLVRRVLRRKAGA